MDMGPVEPAAPPSSQTVTTPLSTPATGGAGSAPSYGGGSAPSYIVRYGGMRLLGEFSARGSAPLQRQTEVIVRSDRGTEWGVVLCAATPQAREALGQTFDGGRILRLPTPEDYRQRDQCFLQEREAYEDCLALVTEARLQMQLVDVESLLGQERIVFYYVSEQRVDFRELVKLLAKRHKARIEMRQIGIRDEAKLLADYGDCGQPVCCNTHLREMPPVSMKMAKLQKATLDPSKISGRCGRLKCCLRYEYDTYEEHRKELPPVGATVVTRHGTGRVVGQELLAKKLMVSYEGQRMLLAGLDEIITVVSTKSPKPGTTPPQSAEREERLLDDRVDASIAPGDMRETEGPRSERGPERGTRPGYQGGQERREREGRPPRGEGRGPRSPQPVAPVAPVAPGAAGGRPARGGQSSAGGGPNTGSRSRGERGGSDVPGPPQGQDVAASVSDVEGGQPSTGAPREGRRRRRSDAGRRERSGVNDTPNSALDASPGDAGASAGQLGGATSDTHPPGEGPITGGAEADTADRTERRPRRRRGNRGSRGGQGPSAGEAPREGGESAGPPPQASPPQSSPPPADDWPEF